MRSVFAALPLAFVLAAAPAWADAQKRVEAAQKAEQRGDWKKALAEWKAAYAEEMNSEYLIAIGDAWAKLGEPAEAKKAYQQYLADGMALPGSVARVKAKIAALDAAPQPAVPQSPASAQLSLSELAKKKPAPEPAAGRTEVKLPSPGPATASAGGDLKLPGTKRQEVPSPTPPKPDPIAMRTAEAPPQALATAERKDPLRVALGTEAQPPVRQRSSATRTVAWITAGVAVVSLGGGALAYSKANSVHNDLTGSVHTGGQATTLLEDERRNRTLSVVGFAGGLLAAGISAALFAF